MSKKEIKSKVKQNNQDDQDLTPEELQQIQDEVDQHIREHGLPSDENIYKMIDELNMSADSTEDDDPKKKAVQKRVAKKVKKKAKRK